MYVIVYTVELLTTEIIYLSIYIYIIMIIILLSIVCIDSLVASVMDIYMFTNCSLHGFN
jgi:hypothetical protein